MPQPSKREMENWPCAWARFDGHGNFTSHYGGWDTVGGGLAAMLITELTQSGRFIVVDPADMDAVLREHEMAVAGLTRRQTPERGQLYAAQLLVRGTVTEFAEKQQGGGFNIGFNFGGISSGVSPRGDTGHVTIDLRVIDSASGQLLASHTVDKKIKSRSLGIDVGANQVAWQGHVAKVDGHRVFLNGRRNANLKQGDSLSCLRITDQLTDPVTGEVLGRDTEELGYITIEQLEDRYAIGRFGGTAPPRRGDLVRAAH